MDTLTPIAELTRALIEAGRGREALASELGVSLPTLLRWAAGRATPRPEMEGKIRTLANERIQHGMAVQRALFQLHADEPQELRQALRSTLQEMREILHRSGRLSSRHEALDELGKLLFAHVMSVDHGGTGISPRLLDLHQEAAPALRSFVAGVFAQHLPTSLSHELSSNDFQLRLKDSENRFGEEVIDCFARLSAPSLIAQMRGSKGVDVLNDTFGHFLADSFTDEKELGQYLTPPEVVRFMVRLAFQSVDESDIAALTHPTQCSRAGLILDPSCGVGSFLSESLRVLQPQVQQNHGIDAVTTWINSMMDGVIVGIDKSERMIRLALTNMALFGVPAANLHLANALVRTGGDASITDSIAGRARIILTNPPFGAEHSGQDLGKYKLGSSWASRSPQSIDSELLFLERYIDWLAPSGVLVAIVPDSVLTNRGLFSDLRKGLASKVQIESVISLPSVTFGVAGTSTKTSVLHLRKAAESHKRKTSVYFGICENIGFEVATRGSQRHKVAKGVSDLPVILQEATGETTPSVGQFVEFSIDAPRWDATFHAGLPATIRQKLLQCGSECVQVRDVATLRGERVDPRRFGKPTFLYIEISDVSVHDCTVRAKETSTREAPSRARRIVRAGDVLVSTVRPERRAIGVVSNELDGVVCSTGFAVLRCTAITPIVLARLLQSDFANAQILRNNMGIAYPAVEEECLLDIVLPIDRNYLAQLGEAAAKVLALRHELYTLETEFRKQFEALTASWV